MIVPGVALALAPPAPVKCVVAVKSGATIINMSLARAWRRQLYGASSVALIVPSAMLAALIVLALGGGFGQVGVLGQIFAGPAAPSVGAGAVGGGAVTATRTLPATAAAALRASMRGAGHRATRVAPVSARSGRGGGALAPVRSVTPIVASGGSAPVPPAPTGSVPSASASSQPSPEPGPSPHPTVVDRVINVVAPVTQQLPAPAGPAVTQAVQAAGSAADSLLPPGVGPGVSTTGVKLP